MGGGRADALGMPFGTRLGYLSGSPRIATIPEAENSGPRSHILSSIKAFREHGMRVLPFIMGDRVPRSWVVTGSQARTPHGSAPRALMVDVVRIALGRHAARQARRALAGEVDWVYERFAAFCAMGRPFQRAGLPWVLETNAPMFYEAKTERQTMLLTSWARKAEIAAYRACDVLVCVTEALKEVVVAEARLDPGKVVVLPNGVDVERFHRATTSVERLHPDFTIVFVGAIFERQGVRLLIDAVNALRAQGLPLRAVIVGDGPSRAAEQEYTHALGLGGVITFTGLVPWERIPGLLAGADLAYSGQLQLPLGRMYHSPLKIYEYLAMELPVVASAFQDAMQLLGDGRCGFLFEPGNGEDLARAIRAAHRIRFQLPAMGAAGRALVQREHSWRSRITTLLASCRRIVPGRTLPGPA